VSLVVFPEGGRTITGRVGTFHDGAFRMAQDFGTAITPVSIVGSFAFNRKTSWLLRPATIVVWLHDTIDTGGGSKRDAAELRDQVWKAVSGQVHASMSEGAADESAPAGKTKA
jgi:1-acyl-sn-glycerol-3-phosphate acyltransferase